MIEKDTSFKDKLKKHREYLDYLERHYENVQKAFKLIEEKCSDLQFIEDDFSYWDIRKRVETHDVSKFDAEEFSHYRKQFFPTTHEKKDSVAFNNAWEHHKEQNPHHWETWTSKNYNVYPFEFIEMLCDWVAMGFEFGDTAKEYYEKNKDIIHLPEWAIKEMYEIFDRIY